MKNKLEDLKEKLAKEPEGEEHEPGLAGVPGSGPVPVITSKPEPKIECIICLENFPKSDFAELACKDNICKGCLIRSIEDAFGKNITDMLNKCPIKNCTNPIIKTEILQKILPKELFEKVNKALEHLAYLNQKEENKSALGDLFRQCPYCPWYYASEGQVINTCPYCHYTYCSDCQTRVDIATEIIPHSGKTCQQMRESEEKKKQLKDYEAHPVAAVNQAAEEIHFLTTRACPHCGAENMPTGGCLWVSCPCGKHYCFGCGSLDGHHHAFACRNAFIHEVKQMGVQFEYTVRFGNEVNLDFTGSTGNYCAEQDWIHVYHNPKRDEYLAEYEEFLKHPSNYSNKTDIPAGGLNFLNQDKYNDEDIKVALKILKFFTGDIKKLTSEKTLDELKRTAGDTGNPITLEDLIDVPKTKSNYKN